MKTFFTLLLSLVSISLFAADVRPKNMLMITSAGQGDIRVVIDGRRFEPRDNSMKIRGISNGTHTIKVYREKNTRFSLFGQRFEMVFNKTIRVKNNVSTLIQIDRYGRAIVRESRVRGGGGGYYGRDDRDFGRGNDFGRDDFGSDIVIDDSDWNGAKEFDFDNGRNSGDYGYNDQDDNYGYDFRKAMSEVEFSRVLQSMQKEWLETNKQKSASQIISTNYLTTNQVKRMLQLFSFESIKLDIAKQAYLKTVDQNNYVIINEEFTFSSSKDELARYIRSLR